MRIKRILAATLALLLAATAAHAQGTPKPKASLNSEISSQFPDNAAGAITPQILRNVTNDMVASAQQYAGVNAQVGTTYTVAASDYGQLVTFTNTNPVAITLPAASGLNPFNVYISNLSTGLVTITPSSGTINGAASLTVSQNQSIWVVSDGTNYQIWKGFGSGTVNSGTIGQMAWYSATGSTVSGNVNANISAGALTLGVANTTLGQLILEGSASGALTITPQATAGTPTWTAGTSSGTPAVTASLPLAITAATGNVTCATCATATLNTAALTKTDDTNVTLTLGGSPASALLNAASITVGWTSQLAVSRGGTGQSTLTANAFLTGNTASAINQVAITGLVKGNGASAPTAYAGGACTNQFIRSLDLNAALTCASVVNADLVNSSVTYGSTSVALGASSTSIAGLTSLGLTSASTINWNSDTYIARLGAANLQLGQANAGSPVAQTLSVQNATGTNTAAAATFTIVGPLATGTGTDGDIVFQTGVKTISGSTGATATTALTLKGETQLASLAGSALIAGTVAPSLSNGNALLYAASANGGLYSGKGLTNDVSLVNSSGTVAANVPTGTTNFNVVGTLTFGTLSAASLGASPTTVTGLTVNNTPNANNDYYLYYSASDGAIRRCTLAACGSVGVAGVSSMNGLNGILALAAGSGITVNSGGSTITIAGAVPQPQGRLTLTSATPVLTATVSAATTLYYALYSGNQIPIYDGTNMVLTTFSELSAATTDNTKSPAAIGASKVNDWFVWSDSGTIRVGHGPDWTNDTTRSAGTALVRVAGIWLNNATITNGPAASRGTYVGTTRSNGSSQLDYIFGAVAANGTAAFFGVWNAYNRVGVATFLGDNTDTWTYTTANTWRPANSSATMRVTMVRGLDEEGVTASYDGITLAAVGTNTSNGIGLDSTTAYTGTTGFSSTATTAETVVAKYSGLPGLGAHYLQAIEFQNTVTSSTWYGDAGTTYLQTGLHYQSRM